MESERQMCTGELGIDSAAAMFMTRQVVREEIVHWVFTNLQDYYFSTSSQHLTITPRQILQQHLRGLSLQLADRRDV